MFGRAKTTASNDISKYLANVEVLIADKDQYLSIIIKDVLRECGFERITLVNNGQKAMEVIKSQDIDLLITDWRMRPLSGIDLISALRNDPESPSPYLPIIMLTGKAEIKDVQTARDSGVTEFMVKPFTAKKLFERLVMVVENPRSFILAHNYRGPDRRRRTDIPPNGVERRKKISFS